MRISNVYFEEIFSVFDNILNFLLNILDYNIL